MERFTVTIEEDGGFAVPPEILNSLGLKEGGTAALEDIDGKLVIRKDEGNWDEMASE